MEAHSAETGNKHKPVTKSWAYRDRDRGREFSCYTDYHRHVRCMCSSTVFETPNKFNLDKLLARLNLSYMFHCRNVSHTETKKKLTVPLKKSHIMILNSTQRLLSCKNPSKQPNNLIIFNIFMIGCWIVKLTPNPTLDCALWGRCATPHPRLQPTAEFSSYSPRNLCKLSCATNKSQIRAVHTTQTNSLFISDCRHKALQL